ncbi:hypothetical protein [Amycolatopsis sp. lyj-109]|uniref:hypothetical protein n=1 Tax=Amycolatopsis sp. lyj-109 TaxID=2789287 RepID=UPI00397C42AB
MTQNWVTFLVALLTAVTGLAGAIGGQLVSARRAVKLSTLERQARIEDHDREERRTAYARFLVATRLVGQAVQTVDPAAREPALSALREAAAYVELAGPEGIEGLVTRVTDTAERWVSMARREGPTSAGTQSAHDGYEAALLETRARMRTALGG